MMNTYYLRFTDEDTWKQAAEAFGLLNLVNVGTEEEPEIQEQWSAFYTHDYACDVIGVIYNDDGVYNQETGEEITPPTLVDGWHVNFAALTIPQEFAAYVINPEPNTPYRVFAS
jgi:hypothetical protein